MDMMAIRRRVLGYTPAEEPAAIPIDNVAETELVSGLTFSMTDNVAEINGTFSGAYIRAKLSNGFAFVRQSAPGSWRSEVYTGFELGKTYEATVTLLSGTYTAASNPAFSVRDSSASSVLSPSTGPRTISSNPAFLQFYFVAGTYDHARLLIEMKPV